MLGISRTSSFVRFPPKSSPHEANEFMNKPERFGYQPDDIVMLTDDAPNPRQLPTKDNIVSFISFPCSYLVLIVRDRSMLCSGL